MATVGVKGLTLLFVVYRSLLPSLLPL